MAGLIIGVGGLIGGIIYWLDGKATRHRDQVKIDTNLFRQEIKNEHKDIRNEVHTIKTQVNDVTSTMNINYISRPEFERAMREMREAVVETRKDIGNVGERIGDRVDRLGERIDGLIGDLRKPPR